LHALPDNLIPTDLPVERIEEIGGFYFRSILLHQVGMVVKQHVHDHEHVTLVCNGRARGWSESEWIGDKGPGEAFLIDAGDDHLFQALEPDTRLVCVHDKVSAESARRIPFHSDGPH
jgi:hypothetical protein